MANKLAKIVKEIGGELLPENKTHANRMEIRGETSNRLYVIAQRKTNGTNYGRWECSCMGWIRYRHCKHLNAMLPTLKQLGTSHTQRIR